MQKNIKKYLVIAIFIAISGFSLNIAKIPVVFGAKTTITPAQELVKIANAPDVYAILDGKKHRIINEKIFLSYGYEWDQIKTVSEQKLCSYQNVKLARTIYDTNVYYINAEKGLKKLHSSEKIFLDYGNKWEDVVILNEQDLAEWTNVNLIKTKFDSAVYLLENGIKRPIKSEKIFLSLGYKWDDIITISHLDMENYLTGEPVQAPVTQLSSQLTPSSGILKLYLSNVSSQEKIVPTGAISEFTEIILLSQEGNVYIDYIIVSATGIISNEDVSNVYLSDKEDKTFNYKTYLNNKKAIFHFSPQLHLKQGERKTLTIKAGLKSNPSSSYKSISFGISSSLDIGTKAILKSGFPIQGDLKQIRYTSGILGEAEITSMPINCSATHINKGAKNQNLGSFKFSEKSGNEDISITEIQLRVQGNIDYTHLMNIDLVSDKGKILATATWLKKNKTVRFDLQKNPYTINKNSSRILAIQGDITKTGEREFRFLIEKSEDIIIIGESSEYELIPTASQEDKNYPIGFIRADNYNKFIINKGTVLAYLNNNSPKEIISGSKNALLAIGEIRAANADIKLKNIKLEINFSGTPLIGAIDFINTKTKEVFYRIGSDILLNNNVIEMQLSPAQYIKAGEFLNFEIRSNISKETKPSDNILITLSNFGFENIPNGEYIIKNETIKSNILTTKTSALFITANENNYDYTAGAEKVKIGNFTIQSNHSEDIYIEGISIKSIDGYDMLAYTNGFHNLKVSLGGRTTIIEQPLATPAEFIFKKYRLPAGRSVNVLIYSDTYPIVAGKKVSMSITGINAYGAESNCIPIIEGYCATSNSINFSSLELNIEKNSNFQGNNISCGENIKIASFKLINTGNEDIKLKKISIEPTETSKNISYSNGYSNLKLINNITGKDITKIKNPLPSINIFNKNIKIKKGESLSVDMYVDINNSVDISEHLQIAIKSIEAYGYSSKLSVSTSNLPLTLQKVDMVCSN
ncbi:hypothetical protein ACFL2L_01460 [Patescibacteria group bacterium]